MGKNKKIIIGAGIAVTIAVIAVVVCILIFGSEKKKESKVSPTTTVAVETTTADPNAGKTRSKLTGEFIDSKKVNKRPVALMYNNIINAIPHSGLDNADICYEAPVEGSITRIMGIFENYDKVKKMGSVRSCRIYYCAFANEWDAIYSHFGQSKYALSYLKSGDIDTISSLKGEKYFFRTSDRVAHFQFADVNKKIDLQTDKVAKKVVLGYLINKPWFEYNEKDGQYYRFQYGKKHIDDQNKKQLHCSNIIVQFVNYKLYPDNKSLDITLNGTGKGWFITNGKAEKITWKKDKQKTGQTKYMDQSGQEIKLNTGKTWICILGNNEKSNFKIKKK